METEGEGISTGEQHESEVAWCPQAQGELHLAGMWDVVGKEHSEALK